MTGMALQALAGYRDQNGVQTAIDRAITRMSGMQNGDGGFTSWGAPNLEGCAQMLAALCALGISVDDARFVKNGMAENCMDAETHMICNERIDEISKVINDDFDMLLELQCVNEKGAV